MANTEKFEIVIFFNINKAPQRNPQSTLKTLLLVGVNRQSI